jgi:hypothetical protein
MALPVGMRQDPMLYAQAVQLLRSKGLVRFKLFDYDPSMLQAVAKYAPGAQVRSTGVQHGIPLTRTAGRPGRFC